MIPAVLPLVVQKHVDELAILLRQRRRLLGLSEATLADLLDLDGRIAAHAEGLRLSGEEGWQRSKAAYDALGEQEGFFAVIHLAVQDPARTEEITAFDQIEDDPALARVAALAICWLGWDYAVSVAPVLLSGSRPAPRLVGLELCDLCGLYPEDSIAEAINGPVILRPAAARLAGRGALTDLMDPIRQTRPDDDCATRSARCIAEALLSGPGEVPRNLRGFAGDDDIEDPLALTVLALKCSADDWAEFIGDGVLQDVVCFAAGHRGDPAIMPRLLDRCAEDPNDPVAHDAIRRIVGETPHRSVVGQKPAGVGNPFAPGAPPPEPKPPRHRLETWWRDRDPGTAPLVHGGGSAPPRLHELLRNVPLSDRSALQLRALTEAFVTPAFAVDAPAWFQ